MASLRTNGCIATISAVSLAAGQNRLTTEEEMKTDTKATLDGPDTLVACWDGLAELTAAALAHPGLVVIGWSRAGTWNR